MSHKVVVFPRSSPIFGDTFQPVCTCGHMGPHLANRFRAEAVGVEHRRRHTGKRVTQW